MVLLENMHLKLGTLAPEVEGVAFLVNAADVESLHSSVQLTEYTTCRAVSTKLILLAG